MAYLDSHISLAGTFIEFEREYIFPLRTKRDKMWEGISSGVQTEEAMKQYDVINNRVIFLENMMNHQRACVSETGVMVEYAQQLITAFESGKVSSISQSLNKLKDVVL